MFLVHVQVLVSSDSAANRQHTAGTDSIPCGYRTHLRNQDSTFAPGSNTKLLIFSPMQVNPVILDIHSSYRVLLHPVWFSLEAYRISDKISWIMIWIFFFNSSPLARVSPEYELLNHTGFNYIKFSLFFTSQTVYNNSHFKQMCTTQTDGWRIICF